MPTSFILTALLLCSFLNSDDVVLHRASPKLYLCGPNAVYMLLKLEGHDVRFSDIMDNTTVGVEGVSVMSVKKDLEKHGVPSEIVRCQPTDLPRISTPYIMYTYPPKSPDDIGHFVIVVAVNDETLRVLDATSGIEKTYYLRKINNIWDGILIVPTRERSLLPEILFLTVSIAFCASTYLRHQPA